MRGILTLEEYDRHYSITDLLDANEALDVMDEQEAWQQEKESERIARESRQR